MNEISIRGWKCHMKSTRPKWNFFTSKTLPAPSFFQVLVVYVWKEYVLLCKGNFLQNYSILPNIKDNFFAYAFDNLCICKYNKTTVVWTFTEND